MNGRCYSPAISPKTQANPIKATIQLDKLVFSCVSTVEDNFDSAVRGNKFVLSQLLLEDTELKERKDPKGRYKYSYSVHYKNIEMGHLDFELFGGWSNEYIRFTVNNRVFYNDTLKYIPKILSCLNLDIKHFNEIDIAVDSHNTNFERIISKNIRSNMNIIKILGRIKRDRNETIKEITYWNQGSQNNPFKSRAVSIKPKKKKTFELCSYNKFEEINVSQKSYILDYHKQFNPRLTKLFRLEIRLDRNEILNYTKKYKLSFSDLKNIKYLHRLVLKYLDRLIVCYSGKNTKKNKVSIIPTDLQYYNTRNV